MLGQRRARLVPPPGEGCPHHPMRAKTKTTIAVAYRDHLDLKVPLVVHLQLTTLCNLGCPRCFYRPAIEPRHLDTQLALELIEEWASEGVRSLALGGGEPTLHPDLPRIVEWAKGQGLRVSLTTNGLEPLAGLPFDRVHISYDEIHKTPRERVIAAIRRYAATVERVGINHILTSYEWLDRVLKLIADTSVSTLTLLCEKPLPRFEDFAGAIRRAQGALEGRELWLDACMKAQLEPGWTCRQGSISMYLGVDLRAKRCSNVQEGFPYTTLEETWAKVKGSRECLADRIQIEIEKQPQAHNSQGTPRDRGGSADDGKERKRR